MTEYESFLQTKKKQHKPSGIEVKKLHSSLFPFQQFTTDWALRTGRACIFAGTGLGKTRMQIEYNRHLPGVKLILAPLAVNGQTVLEAQEVFGTEIRQAEKHGDIKGEGIYITNYDRLHLFDDVKVDAVTLDESSIIKSHDGAYRNYIQERFKDVPYKLCLTATPSPNDYMELGTHAEFMGAMTRAEMLATYFTHDGGETSKWRLKGHSKQALATQRKKHVEFLQSEWTDISGVDWIPTTAVILKMMATGSLDSVHSAVTATARKVFDGVVNKTTWYKYSWGVFWNAEKSERGEDNG